MILTINPAAPFMVAVLILLLWVIADTLKQLFQRKN